KRSEPDPNQGTLLLDATCAPADIAYPTDITLLNEAREKLEGIIDTLHEPHVGQRPKPRTYREKARRAYLALAKQRRIGHRALRRGIGKQLTFIKRDLRIIEELAANTPLTVLSKRQYKQLLVIQELYRQQRMMHTKRVHHVEDRIVSIHQPHIRPIVRGKAKAKVEFGAKVSVSMVQGFAFLERRQWDNFNEGVTLIESVETYKNRFGVYPKEVLADQIYRNREN
ncbi:IS5/IS1182 family transposase, partial [Marinicrinis lubricantis]